MNDFILSLMLLGSVGSAGGQLPWWATANRFGIMPERDGALAQIQAYKNFDADKALQWRFGASLGANCEFRDTGTYNVFIDELYGSLRWKVLTLDIGSKRRNMDFYGADPSVGSLSVTGGHIAESGNARTMPGYNISHAPVSVPFTGDRLKVYGEWGDYRTVDKRYVQDALVHRTKLGMTVDITERLSFGALLDHYAIWGGHHPSGNDILVSFNNYIRTVTGSSASDDGNLSDRINVIGDQGGSEAFGLTYRGNGWKAELRHDIPYSDKSGMRFKNFPDGVNTLHFSFDRKDRWISDILFEYHYTMYQSGPINGEVHDSEGHSLTPPGVSTTGLDNYFNNGFYKSGWTHFGRPICSPLCFPTGTAGGNCSGGMSGTVTLGIENNRYKAHHIGLGGKLWRRHPYRLMLTRSINHGTYGKPYTGESQYQKPWGSVRETGLSQFSACFNGIFEAPFSRLASKLSVIYGLYCDSGQILPTNMGASLGMRLSL